MIKAIIFDLDGVLIDACEWHYLALNKALKEITDYEISREDHDFVYNGLPTRVKLKKLSEHVESLRDDEVLRRVEDLKQDYTIDFIKESLGIDSQKCSMLAMLAVDGMKLACVTNSIRGTTTEMLGRSGIQRYLHVIITNEDVLVPKPHPNGYWNVMSLLGVLPEETLIIEDSDKGIQAARATGAHVWKVSNAQEVTWRNLARELDHVETNNKFEITIKEGIFPKYGDQPLWNTNETFFVYPSGA
jgi:beta-phosphoglucomutase-like phosphatase (HAD superfamily)